MPEAWDLHEATLELAIVVRLVDPGAEDEGGSIVKYLSMFDDW